MNPGALPVIFTPPGLWQASRLNKASESSGLSSFTQVGCTLQASRVKEDVDNTVYYEVDAKLLTPANANTTAVEAEWVVSFAENDYRVVEYQPIYDQWGRLDHCSFLLKDQN